MPIAAYYVKIYRMPSIIRLMTRYLSPWLYMGAIFYVSSIPGTVNEEDQLPTVLMWAPPLLQNFLHIPLYAGLAWLWFHTLRLHLCFSNALFIATSITISYGIFDEWHQSMVPGRYAGITDVVMNIIGVSIVAILLRLRKQRQ
jgi:hypothetical protein